MVHRKTRLSQAGGRVARLANHPRNHGDKEGRAGPFWIACQMPSKPAGDVWTSRACRSTAQHAPIANQQRAIAHCALSRLHDGAGGGGRAAVPGVLGPGGRARPAGPR